MAAKKAPEPVNVLRGHTSDVQALAFLPDGRLLAGCACSARRCNAAQADASSTWLTSHAQRC
jgi:WD40 repeat protein